MVFRDGVVAAMIFQRVAWPFCSNPTASATQLVGRSWSALPGLCGWMVWLCTIVSLGKKSPSILWSGRGEEVVSLWSLKAFGHADGRKAKQNRKHQKTSETETWKLKRLATTAAAAKRAKQRKGNLRRDVRPRMHERRSESLNGPNEAFPPPSLLPPGHSVFDNGLLPCPDA
ncbi:hypothetical protein BKA80DRAFT_107517 [Phyllosticta citrichinensis]